MIGRLALLVTLLTGYLTLGIRGDFTAPSPTTISITRNGCDTTKLCLGDNGCDPAGSVLCSFISAQVNASNVTFELFGNSTGYIALVLSTNVDQGGPVFVCARGPLNSTSSFFFQTATQSGRGGNLTLTNTPNVSSITYFFNGSVSGNFLQCQFTVLALIQAINSASGSLNVQVSLIRGEVTENGTLNTPSFTLFSTTGLVNLTLGASSAPPTNSFGHLGTPTVTKGRISRAGCDKTKLCLGDRGCDPTGNDLCTFISASAVNATNADVAFELFGKSPGYIALVLSTNATVGGGLVFVCSRDPFNATRGFFFRTAKQSGRGGNLTLSTSPPVDTIKYNLNESLSGSFLQCTFITRSLTQAANNRAAINFGLSLVTGTVRADGTFDAPTGTLFNITTVDLAAFSGSCSSLIPPLTQAITVLMSLLALQLL